LCSKPKPEAQRASLKDEWIKLILEAVTLECKQRNVNTAEVREALDFLEPHIKPDWLIPQFRHHALQDRSDNDVDLEEGNTDLLWA
jgi:hypothetical protein